MQNKSRIFLLAIGLIFSVLSGFAGKISIEVTYAPENDNVHVIVDNFYKGRNMTTLKVDPNIVKSIRFFQDGYYSFEIKVSSKLKQFNYNIQLKKRPEAYSLKSKYMIQVLPLQNNATVTNFTDDDLSLTFKKLFSAANVTIGNDLAMFPNIQNLKKSNVSISPTILNYSQIKGMSVSPYYNLAEITINWVVTDLDTKSIVFNKEFTSNHCIRYKSVTGLNSNEEMLKTVENSIDQGFELFLTDPDFLKTLKN